ncbi:uncharacterized protein LOC135838745 [Planococcus citri]|uniref:uncharacterized protein LOC135838745 n=1 Tax=Planococcus citri TaxID=170843 RepID=UPI0031F74F06
MYLDVVWVVLLICLCSTAVVRVTADAADEDRAGPSFQQKLSQNRQSLNAGNSLTRTRSKYANRDPIDKCVYINCPIPMGIPNPICGTNGRVYWSMEHLQCAEKCGRKVQFAHYGFCANKNTVRPLTD